MGLMLLPMSCKKDDDDDDTTPPTTQEPDPGDPDDPGGVDVDVADNSAEIGDQTVELLGFWDKPSEPTGNGTTTLLRISGQESFAVDLVFEGDEIEPGTYKIADNANTLVPASDEVLLLAGIGNSGVLVPTTPGSSSLSIVEKTDGTVEVKLSSIELENFQSWQEPFSGELSFSYAYDPDGNAINSNTARSASWGTTEFTFPSEFWVSSVTLQRVIEGETVTLNFVGIDFMTETANENTTISDGTLTDAFSGVEGVYVEYLFDGGQFGPKTADHPITYEVTDGEISGTVTDLVVVNRLDPADERTISFSFKLFK